MILRYYGVCDVSSPFLRRQLPLPYHIFDLIPGHTHDGSLGEPLLDNPLERRNNVSYLGLHRSLIVLLRYVRGSISDKP